MGSSLERAEGANDAAAPRRDVPSLKALVQFLCAPVAGARPHADLVQLDADAAALALAATKRLVVILMSDPERSSRAALSERIGAVLRTERPDVIAGLAPEAIGAVILGAPGRALEEPHVPEFSEQLARAIDWYAITPDGLIAGRAHGTDMTSLLTLAMAGARALPANSADLVAAERRGEESVGAAGAVRRFATATNSLGRCPATIALGGILVSIYLLELLWGSSAETLSHVRMGALTVRHPPAYRWWQLITAGYLHAGAGHLIGNLQALILCYFAELLLRPARFVLLFTLAVIGGNVAALYFADAPSNHLGASGGIFGLATVVLLFTLRDHRYLPDGAARSLRRMFGVLLGINVLSSMRPGVSLSSHLGGALSGAALLVTGVLTFGLPRPTTGARARPWVTRLYQGAAAACVVATITALAMAWSDGKPWALAVPQGFHRAGFGSLPVSLVIPALLREPPRTSTGSAAVGAGDGWDAVMVSVAVRWLSDAVPEPLVASETEALRARETVRGPRREYQWRSPPSVVQRAGRPALFLDQARSGVRYPRYGMIFGALLVDVQFRISASAPAAWQQIDARIMDSIEVQPNAPGWQLPPVEWEARATVRRVRGVAGLAPGAECRVTQRRFPESEGARRCRWRVTCGGELLYGADSLGWSPCADASWPAGTRVLDAETTAQDRDGALSVDEVHGTLTLRDDASSPSGAFELEAALAPATTP